jgi:hypothetical protein
MTTYIRFDKEHSIAVEETPEEIRDRIIQAGPVEVPIIHLTRGDDFVLVNAKNIRTISPPGLAA